MCLHWLTQCFWNYLDWPEICHYVCTCVVMGPDYQVYTCVAVLKHLQPDILQRTQSQELQVFLKMRESHVQEKKGQERIVDLVVSGEIFIIKHPFKL